jgi:hypothetical protein
LGKFNLHFLLPRLYENFLHLRLIFLGLFNGLYVQGKLQQRT